jgi:hypothetical protein
MKKSQKQFRWWMDSTSPLAHAVAGKGKKGTALCGHKFHRLACLSISLKPQCPNCAFNIYGLMGAMQAADTLDQTLVAVGEVVAARHHYETALGYKVGGLHQTVPEGSSETARITHRECKEEDVAFENIREVVNGNPERVMMPGKFTILHTKMFSCAPFMERARGHVLVLGLGLGATLLPVLKNPTVQGVTVIEKSKDIIDLVRPNIMKAEGARKLSIIWADCTRWRPGKLEKYNTIWIDIWPDVSLMNLPELLKLKAKYKKYLASGNSWIGAWEEKRLLGWLEEEKAKRDDPFCAVGGRIPSEVKLGGKKIRL